MSLEAAINGLVEALQTHGKLLAENTDHMATIVGAAREKLAKPTAAAGDAEAVTRGRGRPKKAEEPKAAKAPSAAKIKELVDEFSSTDDDDEYNARVDWLDALIKALDPKAEKLMEMTPENIVAAVALITRAKDGEDREELLAEISEPEAEPEPEVRTRRRPSAV